MQRKCAKLPCLQHTAATASPPPSSSLRPHPAARSLSPIAPTAPNRENINDYYKQESYVTCPDHPTKAKHGHGAPRPDATARFAFTNAAGKAVTAACPGAKLTVAVSFGTPRLAMLTADGGAFAKADKKCPARVVMDRTKGYARAAAQTAEFTAPCGREQRFIYFLVCLAACRFCFFFGGGAGQRE